MTRSQRGRSAQLQLRIQDHGHCTAQLTRTLVLELNEAAVDSSRTVQRVCKTGEFSARFEPVRGELFRAWEGVSAERLARGSSHFDCYVIREVASATACFAETPRRDARSPQVRFRRLRPSRSCPLFHGLAQTIHLEPGFRVAPEISESDAHKRDNDADDQTRKGGSENDQSPFRKGALVRRNGSIDHLY